ncbi:hypothetical protein SLS62_001588 [Diatrype stigma]|uniref:Uncharacterized protein n=1 Tax=Diatrype stigma TaxID=117547 RepID=A0AAN9YVN8_9PEZI
MASDTLPATLGFLTDAAHLLAKTSPEISGHLMTERNSLMSSHDLQQSDIQRQHVCGCCGHIMIPGQGSKLKLETDRALRRKVTRRMKAERSATSTKAAMKEANPTRKTRKRFECGMCGRYTIITMPPAAPVSRNRPKQPATNAGTYAKQSSIPANMSAGQAGRSGAVHLPLETPKAPSANASSKKRAKSRKQGLQALLQQSQSNSSLSPGGLGLSLSDFLKK